MRPRNMTLSQLYLSSQGRIPRSTFWLRLYLPVIVLTTLAMAVDMLLGTFDEEVGLGVFSGILGLLVIYPSVVVSIKRLHDRDHSGLFYLLMFVPLVNLWPLIEIYFLRGTRGPNQFGPDPLED